MRSLFFDSQVTYDEENNPIYDRANVSSDLRKSFKSFISNGVYATPSTEFQVTAGAGMTVNVLAGRTWIEGAFAWETETRGLVVQASETQDRIDRVVLRLDLSLAKRNIDLYVLKGTAGVSPIAPVLTRNDTIYEIALADVLIAKNTGSISQSRIADTRLNTALCGIVTGIISQVDTTALYSQVQADLAGFKSTEQTSFNTWRNGQEAAFATWRTGQETGFSAWRNTQENDFNVWFASIQEILDENIVTNLYNLIDGLQNSKADTTTVQALSNTLVELDNTKADKTAITTFNGTATKAGNMVTITVNNNGKTDYTVTFTAPSNFNAPDMYRINGTAVTLTDLNNKPVEDGWKQGSLVTFNVTGNKAFLNLAVGFRKVGT